MRKHFACHIIYFIGISFFFALSSCQSSSPKTKDFLSNHQDTILAGDHSSAGKLTSELIDTSSNADLSYTVFDDLLERLPSDSEDEYKTVLSWNKSRQAIYMINLLEAEVNNGGFNQFYYNPSGMFYKQLPAKLKMIGATLHAALTEEANALYEKEKEAITKEQDGTIEGFSKSYKNNPLDKYDDKFYKLDKKENLADLQADYIRKHKSDFLEP